MSELRPTEILLSAEQIQKRVAELAAELRRDFPDDLHVIAVLKGAFVFLSDLIRHIPGAVSLSSPSRYRPTFRARCRSSSS